VTTATTDEVIEVRVEDIAQLFHILDPFPFRERDFFENEPGTFVDIIHIGSQANQPIARRIAGELLAWDALRSNLDSR